MSQQANVLSIPSNATYPTLTINYATGEVESGDGFPIYRNDDGTWSFQADYVIHGGESEVAQIAAQHGVRMEILSRGPYFSGHDEYKVTGTWSAVKSALSDYQGLTGTDAEQLKSAAEPLVSVEE